MNFDQKSLLCWVRATTAAAADQERGPLVTVSTAERLLAAIRARDLRCPVLVFAGAVNVDERKKASLGMGALAYCCSFADLYRRIEEVLSPSSKI